jgi:hypothetical protein
LASKINARTQAEKLRERRGDGLANGAFPHIYQGLEGLWLSLTCLQGDFAEDTSEEGIRTKKLG